MTDFAAARLNMVESQICCSGVTERRLIDALQAVPRELFVPAERQGFAYMDDCIRVKDAAAGSPARYLMEPRAFAKLVHLAEVREGDVVLDVGCATGYSTAILARLANSVVALENDPELVEKASANLAALEIHNVAVLAGSLPEGQPKQGPYDVIVLNGAVDHVPSALLDQLAEGGRLVAVVGKGPAGRGFVYLKSDGRISKRDDFDALVEALPGFEAVDAFVF